VQKIHVAGTHLLGIISDILDLSKIEAGRMELHLESFPVATMIADVVATAQRLVAQNDNHFEVRAEPELGEMTADLTKVRQILFNLLSNAAKFTEHGTVTLEVTRTKGGPGPAGTADARASSSACATAGSGCRRSRRTGCSRRFIRATRRRRASTAAPGSGWRSAAASCR
jgi:signal transduction histidine kinase